MRKPLLLAGVTVALGILGLAADSSWDRTSSSPRKAEKTVAAAVSRQTRPILLPNVKPGKPWPGVWHKAKPDEVLSEGLRFEVCDGIITGVVSAPGPEIDSLVGSRYVPGDLDATDVTKALWRSLDLELAKLDGSVAKLGVLRPLWWLEETRATAGATVDLAIHEAGIEGSARVLAIGPCPVDSRDNPPGGQVVIGKIEHHNAVALDLIFNGEADKPLGVTANHPIYSEDRDTWVPTGDLKVGEQVRTADGTARLTARSQRRGRQTVYNMEVHRSHAYFVSDFAVLAHNTGIAGCSGTWIKRDLYGELNGLVGRADKAKFAAALKKGLVGPHNQSGVKMLSPLYNGYKYELKISGSSQRLLGNINDKGILLFDKFVAGGLH